MNLMALFLHNIQGQCQTLAQAHLSVSSCRPSQATDKLMADTLPEDINESRLHACMHACMQPGLTKAVAAP